MDGFYYIFVFGVGCKFGFEEEVWGWYVWCFWKIGWDMEDLLLFGEDVKLFCYLGVVIICR